MGILGKKQKDLPCNHTDMYKLSSGNFYINTISDLPKNCKAFSLYPMGRNGDLEFPEVSIEAMDKLFVSHTITSVSALYSPYGNTCNQWWKGQFPHLYYKFLQAHHMTDNVFYNGEKSIATLTHGINKPITNLLIGTDFDELEGNTHTLYGYSDFTDCVKSFTDIEKTIASKPFDLSIEYHECPDYLSIIIDTDKVDISDIITAIKEVLRGYGKTLLIDIGELYGNI